MSNFISCALKKDKPTVVRLLAYRILALIFIRCNDSVGEKVINLLIKRHQTETNTEICFGITSLLWDLLFLFPLELAQDKMLLITNKDRVEQQIPDDHIDLLQGLCAQSPSLRVLSIVQAARFVCAGLLSQEYLTNLCLDVLRSTVFTTSISFSILNFVRNRSMGNISNSSNQAKPKKKKLQQQQQQTAVVDDGFSSIRQILSADERDLYCHQVAAEMTWRASGVLLAGYRVDLMTSLLLLSHETAVEVTTRDAARFGSTSISPSFLADVRNGYCLLVVNLFSQGDVDLPSIVEVSANEAAAIFGEEGEEEGEGEGEREKGSFVASCLQLAHSLQHNTVTTL